MRPDREERIRKRAYEIWDREGRPDGRQAEHWELATTEIEAEERRAPTQDVPAARVDTAPPVAEFVARDPGDQGGLSEPQRRRQPPGFAAASDPLGRVQGGSDIPVESAMAAGPTVSPKRRGGGKGRGTRSKKAAPGPPSVKYD